MNYNKMRATWWYGTCYHKEQLDAIVTNLDVKNHAYILHDKDKNENGEPKKPHYHFLVQLYKDQRGSWFKAFASDDLGMVLVQPSYAPQGAFDYLTHNTPAAIKAGKHIYDDSEVTNTILAFDDGIKPEDEHQALLDDIRALNSKEITFEEFIQRKPKRIYSISSIRATSDLLLKENKYENDWRIVEVTYIHGKTGKGKTRFVAEKYGYKNLYRVTKYDHTSFDGYKGQDVVVFEEFRSSCKIEEMLNYLDGHPMYLPSRYTDKGAAFTKVFILTNWSLDQQYKNIQIEHPGTWEALMRRIKNVYNLDSEISRQKLLNGEPNPNPLFKPKTYINGMEVLELTEEEKAKMPF